LKILSGESNEVCLVQEYTMISSKAIYRNGYSGSSTMEMILLDILSNISPTCTKYAKMRKLFVVLLYALLVICLFATWRGETKYSAVLLHGTEFEERNQGEKMRSDAIEVSSNFIS